MKSFSALIYMLNYCRKFEDVKFNIFEDMTLLSQCIFIGTPGISLHYSKEVSSRANFFKQRPHFLKRPWKGIF